MSEPKRIFDDHYFDGVNISEEARQITRDAADAMRGWIQESVTELTKQLTESANNAVQRFEETHKQINNVLDGLDKAVADLDTKLKNVPPLAPGPDQQIKDLQEAVGEIKKDLEDRKAMARQVGEKAIAGIKIAARGIGLPL
jgi:ABC-type transporter Mla subunit MlaD